MQHMLAGEADGADAPDARWPSLPRRPRRCGFSPRRLPARRRRRYAALRNGVGGRAGGGERGGGFAGKAREVLLHRLEFSDRPLEGDALVGVATLSDRIVSSAPAVCTLRTVAPISSSAGRIERRPAHCGRPSRVRRSRCSERIAGEVLTVARCGSRRLDQGNARAVAAWPATAMCSESLAKGTPLACPLRVPSAFSGDPSRGRAGATVIAPAGACRPACASSQPASSVSASGTGSAERPATPRMAKPSARLAPAPPCVSGTQASGSPASASARHSGSFQRCRGAVDRLRIGEVGKYPRRRFGDDMSRSRSTLPLSGFPLRIGSVANPAIVRCGRTLGKRQTLRATNRRFRSIVSG